MLAGFLYCPKTLHEKGDLDRLVCDLRAVYQQLERGTIPAEDHMLAAIAIDENVLDVLQG
jgi:hypothetical protein